MIRRNSVKFRLFPVVFVLSLSTSVFGQTTVSRNKNNPYSPSPVGKVKERPAIEVPTNSDFVEATFLLRDEETSINRNRPSIAQRTFKSANNNESDSIQPTEIYKVGVGDVLFVNLKNSTQGSRYCTVQPDGTIDFPLAGENLVVANQTVEEIEQMLVSGITLFSDPQVEITVREYSSHKITVSGMVENPGEKNLRREAIPLFVIRSEAGVRPNASKVVIKRAPLSKLEIYDLSKDDTGNVFIYPGNSVEFTGEGNGGSTGSYYIAGEITTAGQKQLTAGLTLYQAVIASGVAKGNPKKATIRRKNDEGVFTNTEYNLRSIQDGKKVDPLLQVGDVVEVRK